jgi:hypothetical protein
MKKVIEELKIADCKKCPYRKRYYQINRKVPKNTGIDVCVKEGRVLTTGRRRKNSIPIPDWCKFEDTE